MREPALYTFKGVIMQEDTRTLKKNEGCTSDSCRSKSLPSNYSAISYAVVECIALNKKAQEKR